MDKITAIILAAGLSSRYSWRGHKNNKLLAEKNNNTMIAYSIAAIKESRVDDMIVITGHDADKIRLVLDGYTVRYVNNPDYQSGMASSLAAGIKALSKNTDAALICLADMPDITPDHINRIIQNGADKICFPVKDNKQGHPVLWPRRFFPLLSNLSGDRGAKKILQDNKIHHCPVAMKDDACFTDYDSDEAVKKWQSMI